LFKMVAQSGAQRFKSLEIASQSNGDVDILFA
jgi:hypothetical protein